MSIRRTALSASALVAHGGLFDVKQHAASGRHIKNVRDNQVDP